MELKAFCKYTEEYFPRIRTLTLYGNALYKEMPSDIDLYTEDKTLIMDAYKQLFPHILLLKYDPFWRGEYFGVSVIVWTRAGGITTNELPKMKEEDFVKELLSLRKQVSVLREVKGADD